MLAATQSDLTLLAFAREAQQKAYAPYSRFRVGAAVYANGEIFQGVNVENAAYGATICAERSAVSAAVTAGCTDITGLAVVGDSSSPVKPCGCCRQVLAEFNPHLRLIMGGTTDEVRVASLDEYLPEPLTRSYLDQNVDR
ncbi:MAG: cytidine deaminase [Coriobacteriia bacterium]|nr:cytidine deaminase [Coriobacteriia bacterium]